MDGSPQLVSNDPLILCDNKANGDCDDDCDKLCENHHKNVHRIANDLCDDYFERNHVIVMWSNCKENVYCTNNYGMHTPQNAIALVTKVETSEGWKHQPIAQILTIDQHSQISGYSVQEVMSINLAHEIAHTLGLNEIYSNSYGDNTNHMDSYDPTFKCIMRTFGKSGNTNFYSAILSGEQQALCDYCVAKLKSVMADDVYETLPVPLS